ncbi:unnamed protein product [Pleuronectes platessa]|uniref:Uncharacterized protein n=1 Tax=Pleuronectes platessa TaxID=8262 RepID=A0A9N7Y803_PLEPL|nr:unnamed protein product [Pleuronectes platessa]
MQMGQTGDRTTVLEVGGRPHYPSATAAHNLLKIIKNEVCVKRGRADRAVVTRRLGVTSEVAGGRDWPPARSSLGHSHGDTVPGHTLSICFTTHGQSHAHSSAGHCRFWQEATAAPHNLTPRCLLAAGPDRGFMTGRRRGGRGGGEERKRRRGEEI